LTEELNPEKQKGRGGRGSIRAQPVVCPPACVFVDTTGFGLGSSPEIRQTTQAFIPHIDAALVVVGADPPIAGEELALVESIGKQVSGFNPGDQQKPTATSDPEREAATKFTREVLEKRLHPPDGRGL